MKQQSAPSLLSVLRQLGLRSEKVCDEALSACEAAWLSGYFAALARDAVQRGEVARVLAKDEQSEVSAPEERRVTVLYGTETGNAQALATNIADRLRSLGTLQVTLRDLAEYRPRSLQSEQTVVVVTSTHGDGTPPERATLFFEGLHDASAPTSLQHVRFAVLGLGDSSYEHFCRAARVVDQRLGELGAQRLVPRCDCDVEYEKQAARWLEDLVSAVSHVEEPSHVELTRDPRIRPGVVALQADTYDKGRPFEAVVLENIRLTGAGSTKEVRHLALGVDPAKITFTPGDALGVCAPNHSSVVRALIQALQLSAHEQVSVGAEQMTLEEALRERLDITVPSPRLLEGWAALSGSAELLRLAGDERGSERRAFLRAHHVLDLVQSHPVNTRDAQAFVALLRPLAPRMYSIASSQALLPREAHLTISVVRYQQRERTCLGVASGHVAERALQEQVLRIYVQQNRGFRLPADGERPILMIGAGTGVAPYRAFMQEREARQQRGPAWLLFGERNFRTDFLYQTEWQTWLRSGLLTRLTPAFSRDQAEKKYVQQRLREQGRDVFDWLERGAHLYVCGDAQWMAPAVHEALLEIVRAQVGSEERARAYVQTLREQQRYQRDVY